MKRSISALIVIIAVVGSIFGFRIIGEVSGQEMIKETSNHTVREYIQSSRNTKVDKEATILGVGDVLISDSIFHDAQSEDGFDFYPMFEHIAPHIQQADFAIANQETMLGGEPVGLSGYPRFNSPKEVGDALQKTGFDMLSIANNHTLDYGAEAVENTIHHLNAIDLPYVGAYESEEDKQTLRTTDVNGLTFSFLSFSYGTNGMQVPEGKEHLIALIDEERIESEVAKAKEESDVVVLNLHYGDEYTAYPNDFQTSITSIAAEAGADIIFGHHPHVLQPFEWLHTSDGRQVFVAYSLGNFISGQEGVERRIGGMAQVTAKRVIAGPATFTIIDEPTFIPVYTDRTNWRDYAILPESKMNEDILPDWEAEFTEAKTHVSQWMDDLTTQD